MASSCVNGSAHRYVEYDATYDARSAAGYAVVVLSAAVVAISTACFLVRRDVHPIKQRSASLVLVQSSAALLVATVMYGVEEAITPPKMPCDLQFLSGMLFPLVVGPPALLRLLRHHQRYLLNRRKQKLATRGFVPGHELAKLRLRTRSWFLYVVFFVLCFPSMTAIVAMYIKNDTTGMGCVNCKAVIGNLYLNLVQGIAYISIFSVLIYKTRHMVDTFHIRRELLHWTIMWTVVLLVMVPMVLVLSDDIDYDPTGRFDPDLFFYIGAFGTQLICVILPVLGTYNIGPYCGYVTMDMNAKLVLKDALAGWSRKGRAEPIVDTVNPLGNGGAEHSPSGAVEVGALNDPFNELLLLLSKEDGRRAFAAHLTSEYSVESITFWLEVESFRDRFDPSTGHKDAENIVRTFIEPSAPLMVNISASQARRIHAALKDGTVGQDLFDESQREIIKLMAQDSYRRFLRGPIYAAYRAEASGDVRDMDTSCYSLLKGESRVSAKDFAAVELRRVVRRATAHGSTSEP